MRFPTFLGPFSCLAVVTPAATTAAQAAITRHCTGHVGTDLISGINKNGSRFSTITACTTAIDAGQIGHPVVRRHAKQVAAD